MNRYSVAIKRSIPAFCIVFSYLLLKPLKMSIFSHFSGFCYLPYAQAISMIILALLLSFYSKYFSKLNVTFFLKNWLTVSIFINIFFMLAVPYCINCSHNILKTVIGFISFVSLDLIPIISLQLFWASCHATHTPKNSRKWYPIFVFAGQIAAMLAPIISLLLFKFNSNETSTSITIIFFLASIGFLFARNTLTTPRQQLPLSGQPSSKGEGISFVLKNPYVIHIALLGMVYETLRISLEYSFLLSLQSGSLLEKSSTLYLYQACIHMMGLLISTLGAYGITYFKNIRYQLLLTPLLGIGGIIICIFWPSTLLFSIVLIIVQGFYNGLHYPAKEMLYTQTPPSVHQGLRAWISSFGKRFAQSCGYGVSALSLSMTAPLSLAIPLFLAGLWSYSALYAGRWYGNCVKD